MSIRKKRWTAEKAISEFSQSEEKPGVRRGTFKIDASFEEAMKKILKAKRPSDKKRFKKD